MSRIKRPGERFCLIDFNTNFRCVTSYVDIAANEMGVHYNTFYKHMQKTGIMRKNGKLCFTAPIAYKYNKKIKTT
jgi:hypothetical protein